MASPRRCPSPCTVLLLVVIVAVVCMDDLTVSGWPFPQRVGHSQSAVLKVDHKNASSPIPVPHDSVIVFPKDDHPRSRFPIFPPTTNVPDPFNETTVVNGSISDRGNLPNCVDHGCPQTNQMCDPVTLSCRETITDL